MSGNKMFSEKVSGNTMFSENKIFDAGFNARIYFENAQYFMHRYCPHYEKDVCHHLLSNIVKNLKKSIEFFESADVEIPDIRTFLQEYTEKLNSLNEVEK